MFLLKAIEGLMQNTGTMDHIVTFLQAGFFSLPFILAGITHIVIIKLGFLSQLAAQPLDFNLTVNKRRLLGSNKSFRGAVVMIAGITLWVCIQSWLVTSFPLFNKFAPVDYTYAPPFLLGILQGIGCIVGEFPNSFVKRQLNIPPGGIAPKLVQPIFWVLDQVDSLIGVLLFGSILWTPSCILTIYLFIITLVIHPLGDYAMTKLGLKRKRVLQQNN